MKEDYPKSKQGDIAVRIKGAHNNNALGRMYARYGVSYHGDSHFRYDSHCAMTKGNWRQATHSEKRAFADGIRNVKDIKDLMLKDAYQIY